MRTVLTNIIGILNESSLYLIMGFALAGVFHVVLARFPRLMALLTGRGPRPVFMATILGLPMPLCSCSVLPAAITLRRQGASKGATSSFLVSVPETDIVSILLTFGLLGTAMAVYRPLAALVTALVVGLLVNAFDRSRTQPTPTSADEDSCCHHDAIDAAVASPPSVPWYRRALKYGFVEIFDDIIAQLFVGIVVAAALVTFLPDVSIGAMAGASITAYAVMLAVGVPMYVCATASTPIAAGLIAGGLTPGAAMVFLLAGPATNIASLFVLRREFGARLLGVYLISIAFLSVALGAAFDWLPGMPAVTVRAHAHEHVMPLQSAATIVLLILILVSFHRTRFVWRVRDRFVRAVTRLAGRRA